jgi:ZIP family zinc transporter
MLSIHIGGALLLTIAEIFGALAFFFTHNTTARKVMTSFGLGFAIAIVLFDMLPDSTEHFAFGYALFAMGIALMTAITVALRKTPASHSNTIAVAGMAMHNFGEGALLSATTGPVSALFALGAVLHKLPEGMATYSLLGSMKEKMRFTLSIAAALMIPLGMAIHLPESVQQPLMSVLAGMILVSISATILSGRRSELIFAPRWQRIAPYAAGAAIGAISCLIA